MEQGEVTAKIKYGKIIKTEQWKRGSAVPTGSAHLVKYIDNKIEVRTAHEHALICLFVDAGGLVSKLNILKIQIYEIKIDIMCNSEDVYK